MGFTRRDGTRDRSPGFRWKTREPMQPGPESGSPTSGNGSTPHKGRMGGYTLGEIRGTTRLSPRPIEIAQCEGRIPRMRIPEVQARSVSWTWSAIFGNGQRSSSMNIPAGRFYAEGV